MDNNIEQNVYNYLAETLTEINDSTDKHNLDHYESEIKAGHYTPQALAADINPTCDQLRTRLRGQYNQMMDNARKMIAEYRTEAERLNELNPDDINDDIKLLQTGVDLLPRDIEALLRRNSDNRTMIQLILRYAEAHNIETSSMYAGTSAEMQRAETLDRVLLYFDKWKDTPDARDMLDKFFGVKK